jgi:hypothetical protein
MRLHRMAITLAMLAASATTSAQTGDKAVQPQRSATLARDIGGFALGMPIADVNKIVPVERLGNDNFQAVRDGITYDFGVTPLGRIYRVASSQNLGRFQVDERFLKSVAARLTAKYGPPTQRSTETFGWSLIEPVKHASGQTLPFTTMWASAYVSKGGDGVSLEIKLLDFRVLWADEAKLNRGPRDKAVDAVKF